MPFIGILSNKKSESEFKKILIQKTQNSNKKFDIININNKSIDNIRNIKFDTILIDNTDLSEYEIYLNKILKSAKYLVINSDINQNFNILKNLETRVITYGFNPKATITASSVEDENGLLCIQRNIETSNKNIVEQQEIMVDFSSTNRYIDMGITGISLIYNMEEKRKNEEF